MYNFVSKERDAEVKSKTPQSRYPYRYNHLSLYLSAPNIVAEIYISSAQCQENAQIFNTTTENELLRLNFTRFFTLLLGTMTRQKKKTPNDKEENRCIKMFHVKHHTNV